MHFTDYLFMQSQSTLKCQILFGAVQYCTLIVDVLKLYATCIETSILLKKWKVWKEWMYIKQEEYEI